MNVRRWILVLLATGVAVFAGAERSIEREPAPQRPPPDVFDPALATDLRSDIVPAPESWKTPDSWWRALVETGETGRIMAEELSRGDDHHLRSKATRLLAEAERRGGWDALAAMAFRESPFAAREPDAVQEARRLDELEAQLPELEARFPGEWHETGCGNSSIGEHSPVLGAYESLGLRACDSLARLVEDPGAERRLRAFQVLRVVECPEREIMATRALSDADPRVRQAALAIVSWPEHVAAAHRPELRRLLGHDDVPTRLAAAAALASCGDVAALPVLLSSARLLADAEHDPHSHDRARALGALEKLTSYGPPVDAWSERTQAARWWSRWSDEHASGFDVRAEHLEALRGCIEAGRPGARDRGCESGRRPSLRVLFELDAPAAADLIADGLEALRDAGWDLAALARHPPVPEVLLAALERKAMDGDPTFEARREAVRVLTGLDPDRARPVVVALLRSDRAGDREPAWGAPSRALAPEEMRPVALALLASAEKDHASVYADLHGVATAEDCDSLLPFVLQERAKRDRIAGWRLLAELRCPAARAPMLAAVDDPDLARALVEPLASYEDPSMIVELPCVVRPCPGSDVSEATLRAISGILRIRTVPGLVHRLDHGEPDVRLGAAAALRLGIRHEWHEAAHGLDGPIDFTSAQLRRASVRAALERATERTGDPASLLARQALVLLDVDGP